MTEATLIVWDDGTAQHEEELREWPQLSERLAALDGVNRTLVTVLKDSGHLACGGSAATGLVVYATFDNTVFHQLVDPSAADGARTVIAGGQAGQYPAHQVVDLNQAEAASRVFFERSELDPQQQWES